MNDNSATTQDEFRAATARLQSTAAWVTAAFGGIATILLASAGFSLAGVGVSSGLGRLVAMGVALALALMATVSVIDAAAKVFVDRYVTLADLSRDLRAALADAESSGAVEAHPRARQPLGRVTILLMTVGHTFLT